MSGQLEALWLELFSQKITPIEASLLTAVERKVDSDSPVLILASVMVRMLYLVLVEGRDSPFRTLASVRRTMEEHRHSVAQISETYRVLELNISEWNGILARTEKDIVELRKVARATAIREVLVGNKENGGQPSRLIGRLLFLVWGGCFLSAGAGALIVALVLK